MAFEKILIKEIFFSLQGETSLTGVPFIFIRLTGCNLRCTYCDSVYAFKGGTPLSIPEILSKIKPFSTKHVLLTGGEPLIQRNTPLLAKALVEAGYLASIETHGEANIEAVSPLCRIIMDIKTPSSKMCREGFRKNLKHLKPQDEIKFVIASKEDYSWAKELVKTASLPTREILFSPASPPTAETPKTPGIYEGVTPLWASRTDPKGSTSSSVSTSTAQASMGASKNRGLKQRVNKMVGSTGIEPATPTVSR